MLSFFVVRIKQDGTRRASELYLSFKATKDAEQFQVADKSLTNFCFPLGPENVHPKEYLASEEFTFTLTNHDGRRFPAFCRKFLPPPPRVGPKARYPQVMCLISEYPWCTFYFKVLQVLEQMLRSGEPPLDGHAKELPTGCGVRTFLAELSKQLDPEPDAGQIIRVPVPKSIGLLGVSPPKMLTAAGSGDALVWTDDMLELQVPPDSGNGKLNRGISLARLLWHVPVSAMMTLVASMLLERRIVIVGQSADTVTAAVQAASALLYPFKWHHIYLSLMPMDLKDYLTAPMPFMVGLPAQMLPLLKGLSMDEVTLIDLDLGKCEPPPNDARDDALHLPWREKLEAALTAAYNNLKNPTEYESSPLIAGIMQQYFLKLIGDYRRFIHEDTPQMNAQFAALLPPANSPRPNKDAAVQQGGSLHKRNASDARDDTLRGFGQTFEHTLFVNHHKRNEKARKFLSLFRHSQMYEVFMQERMRMAAQQYETDDPFEEQVVTYVERKKQRQAQYRFNHIHAANAAKWSSKLKKHRRTDSEDANSGGTRNLNMRRITTDPTQLDASALQQIDPALFFEDDDDLDDELDVAGGPPSVVESSGPSLTTTSMSYVYDSSNHDHAASHPAPTPALHRELAALQQAEFSRSSLPDLQHASTLSAPSATAFFSEGPSPSAASSPVMHPGSSGKKSGLIFSFQSGNKHYEGSLTDVVKDMWSSAKKTVQPSNLGGGQGQGVGPGPSSMGLAEGGSAGGARSFISNLFGGKDREDSTGGSGTYRKQLTGDGKPKQMLAQRYMPQTTGGSLLDSVGGKLKQPPAPSRPINLPQPQVQASSQAAPVPPLALNRPTSASTASVQQGAAPAADWDPFGLGPASGSGVQQVTKAVDLMTL